MRCGVGGSVMWGGYRSVMRCGVGRSVMRYGVG